MADRIGQQLGNYRLLRLLGQGGFAEVYLAEHLHLKTHVAIKLLYNKLTPQHVHAFLNEAQVIAALKHPHILRVLDFGFEQALPFLVMDYAPGGTLRDRYPHETIIPLAKIVSYVNQIASALTYAHAQKLIHRDIKPENMLIDANDTLLLGDFGIVATAHSTTSMKTVDSAGTVHYMAPEQINGKPRPQSDQYALAIVIYEWLTGERPFTGNNFVEIAMRHLSDPPPSPRQRVPSLSVGIEQVILKALAKDPNRRFPSIMVFAQQLEQIAQQARAPRTSIWQKITSKKQQSEQIAQQANAPSISQKPDSNGNAPLIYYQQPLVPTQLASTRLPFPQTLLSQNAHHVLQGTTLLTYEHDEGPVKSVCWSPDGQFLASAGDDKVIVREVKSGKIRYSIHGSREEREGFNMIAWSPDGRTIASVDSIVRLWNMVSGKEVLQYENHKTGYLKAVAWSPDGKYLASAGRGPIHIWEAATGKELMQYNGHTGTVNAVAWSPDGKRLASTSSDKTVHVWEAMTGKELFCYKEHSATVNAVAWSPDGQSLASAGDDHLHVWDATSGEWIYKDLDFQCSAVAWSPDGSRLVFATGEKIQITAFPSHTVLFEYELATPVKMISWSPDSQRFAFARDDHTIHVYKATSGALLQQYKDHTAIIKTVAWSPDGRFLASAGNDCTVSIREANTGNEVFRYREHTTEITTSVTTIAWSPDSRLLASADFRGAHIWEATSGKVIWRSPESFYVRAIDWSPDGRLVAYGIKDQVSICEVAMGKDLFQYDSHAGYVNAVAWSPNGRFLASCSNHETHIWEVASGKTRYQYEHTQDDDFYPATSVTWSPDGEYVALSDEGFRTVTIMKVASNKLAFQHKNLGKILWSPDGRYLASISPENGRDIYIHELSGKHHFTYRGHSGRVNTLAWSPDGKQIISGGYEVHVWQAGSKA